MDGSHTVDLFLKENLLQLSVYQICHFTFPQGSVTFGTGNLIRLERCIQSMFCGLQ